MAFRRSRRMTFVGALLLLGLLALPMQVSAAAATKCTPNNAPVGTTINVAMTGLPANENVTITTASAGTILTRQMATTNAEGNVSLDLDTSKDTPGDYTVQAANATGTMLTQGRAKTQRHASRLPLTSIGAAVANDDASATRESATDRRSGSGHEGHLTRQARHRSSSSVLPPGRTSPRPTSRRSVHRFVALAASVAASPRATARSSRSGKPVHGSSAAL